MDDENVARLSESLGSNDPNERAQAAVELGQHRVTEALPDLLRLTADTEDIAALAGMYACWRLGSDQVDAGRILEAVTSSDEALMQQAVETVSAIGESLVPRLVPYLKGDGKKAVAALRLLEEIGGSAAHRAIENFPIRNPEVAQEAKQILSEWADDDD